MREASRDIVIEGKTPPELLDKLAAYKREMHDIMQLLHLLSQLVTCWCYSVLTSVLVWDVLHEVLRIFVLAVILVFVSRLIDQHPHVIWVIPHAICMILDSSKTFVVSKPYRFITLTCMCATLQHHHLC